MATRDLPVTLRPMTERDLPLLHDWLNRPHIVEWWGGEAERPSLEEVLQDYRPEAMAQENVTPYIAMQGAVAIGFAQSYVALGSGDGWWADETDPGVRGIDQSLADPQRLGQGLGAQLVRMLAATLFADPAVTAIQTDPSPDNHRAIRCYENAGFTRRGIVTTPDGPAVYMTQTRAAFDAACRARLVEAVRESAWFMPALRAVRALGLPSWCIGAGAVRNLVWDRLHGHGVPSRLADVDVAHFDASDPSPEPDAALQARLRQAMPDLPWEVTNQAAVHIWFEAHFGHPVDPLPSLEAAVASWPEFATCVGITLRPNDAIEVVAPHGLADLFSMTIRRNPARVSLATYRDRVAQKRYAERWPGVTVIPS